jgi:hypothetical protein
MARFPSPLPSDTVLDCILDQNWRENGVLHVLDVVKWKGQDIADCESSFRSAFPSWVKARTSFDSVEYTQFLVAGYTAVRVAALAPSHNVRAPDLPSSFSTSVRYPRWLSISVPHNISARPVLHEYHFCASPWYYYPTGSLILPH